MTPTFNMYHHSDTLRVTPIHAVPWSMLRGELAIVRLDDQEDLGRALGGLNITETQPAWDLRMDWYQRSRGPGCLVRTEHLNEAGLAALAEAIKPGPAAALRTRVVNRGVSVPAANRPDKYVTITRKTGKKDILKWSVVDKETDEAARGDVTTIILTPELRTELLRILGDA